MNGIQVRGAATSEEVTAVLVALLRVAQRDTSAKSLADWRAGRRAALARE
jgi:hypothetical protein